MDTAKQKHMAFGKISRLFDRRFPEDFHENKMAMGLYNGKKVVMTYIRPTGNSCLKEQRKPMWCIQLRQESLGIEAIT